MYGKNNHYYLKCIKLNDDKADKNVEKTHVDLFKGRQTDFGEKNNKRRACMLMNSLWNYEIPNFYLQFYSKCVHCNNGRT